MDIGEGIPNAPFWRVKVKRRLDFKDRPTLGYHSSGYCLKPRELLHTDVPDLDQTVSVCPLARESWGASSLNGDSGNTNSTHQRA